LGSALQGLTTEQYKANLAKYGKNALTPPPTMPAWLKFLLQFTNFFALLLLAGGTLCFIGYGIDSSRTGEDVEADPTNVRPPPPGLHNQMHPFGLPLGRSPRSLGYVCAQLYLGVVLYLVVIITATFSHFQEAKSEQIMEGVFPTPVHAARAICTATHSPYRRVRPRRLPPGAQQGSWREAKATPSLKASLQRVGVLCVAMSHALVPHPAVSLIRSPRCERSSND
jgi:hypothetical protein